jgi:hypothetical protein
MILIYSVFVLALGIVAFLARSRARALESKYARVARQAEQLLRQSNMKEGNSNRNDPYLAAKRQYVLGQVAQKRDRVEVRYTSWQQFSEKLDRLAGRVRGWKGFKLPYTFGALDVASVLWAIDHFGFGDHVSVRHLFELIRSRFGG